MLRCLKTNFDFYETSCTKQNVKKAVQFQPQPYIFCGHAKLVV